MFQQILNEVLPIIITAIVAVLSVVIKSLGDAGVAFIEKKKDLLVQKISADTYNQNLAFAKAAWNIVDEYFRISPNIEKTFDAKQKMFTDELKKFVPSLTNDEIAQLRQTIAGEVNKGKDVVLSNVADSQTNSDSK